MDITYKVGDQDREKGIGGPGGDKGGGQSITPDLQQDEEESHIRN